MEIAVVGGSEFVLGFRLAGIKKALEVEEAPNEVVRKVMEDEDVGIIIIDQKTIDKLDERTREDVEMSVSPVAVILSEESSQESLRKMIKKSIGVDLWQD